MFKRIEKTQNKFVRTSSFTSIIDQNIRVIALLPPS